MNTPTTNILNLLPPGWTSLDSGNYEGPTRKVSLVETVDVIPTLRATSSSGIVTFKLYLVTRDSKGVPIRSEVLYAGDNVDTLRTLTAACTPKEVVLQHCNAALGHPHVVKGEKA